MRLRPRERAPWWLLLAVPLAALALALAVAALPIAMAGAEVGAAYAGILRGSLGTPFAVGETLARATPLVLTGLAAAVAFRARLWNIGAEGQLYMGALAAVALGTGWLALPAWLLLPLVLLAGAAAGGLMMLGPTVLKLRLGVDEVVTTLLLNFVVLLLVSMMIEGPLKDPMGMGWPQSPPMVAEASLPRLVPRLRTHAGLLIALAAALLVWVYVRRTVWGFELRATGHNAAAAGYAGMPVTRVMLTVGLISGALAGLAGVSEIAGLKGNLTRDLSPGYGYAGIVVAMLAQLNPLAVVPAALFVAGVFVGADSMSRAVGISSYIANLIVALALLAMLVASLALRWRLARA
jgi:ABC-type uncharacterized transport system permease subunit